jgi:hypothetical protein
MLDVDVQGAVRVELERVAVADGKAVDGVRQLKPCLIVHRQRPKTLYRWKLVLREVQDVRVIAASGLPSASDRSRG